MTGKADWELVMANGGIAGVRSRSAAAPLKKAGFGAEDAEFANASAYSGWAFSIKP
jgi:hypothetical protein